MRFPGGCYVEGGDHLVNRPEWKKALGPIETRPGHANANWGYWSTDGEQDVLDSRHHISTRATLSLTS